VLDDRALARIRKALAQQPSPLSTPLTEGTPVFRVTVVGRPFELAPFKETIRPGWQPVQPGLFYHNEIAYRFTPPQARPYGAFTGPELVQVAATSLASALLIQAVGETVKAIRGGVRRVQVKRINRQIDEDLAIIEEANRRARAKYRQLW
jgi:hypothetical protein